MATTQQVYPKIQEQRTEPAAVLAWTSVGSVVLFLASLVTGVALTGSVYASPFGDTAPIRAYFVDNPGAVQLVGVLQFLSALLLAVFVAVLAHRLRGAGAPASVITVGGTLAVGFLALNGLVQWALTHQEVTTEDSLVRALNYLFFILGGPAHVAALGLVVAGVSVAAKTLPKWLTSVGFVIAAVSVLSILTMAVQPATVLVPIGRFTGLIWLIVISFLLPRTGKNPRF